MNHIVVLGGSFAGVNAAFELELELGSAAEITVVARDPRFIFVPSLIWVVPGWRKPGQISMQLEPILYRRGIKFRHGRTGSANMFPSQSIGAIVGICSLHTLRQAECRTATKERSCQEWTVQDRWATAL